MNIGLERNNQIDELAEAELALVSGGLALGGSANALRSPQ
jgi:hypothetical protein